MHARCEIRRQTERDAEEFYNLRLSALTSSPYAFGESAAEFQNTTVQKSAERLGSGSADSFVMGAFDGPKLVGTIGLYREPPAKRRHKGHIWGVFVAGSHRGSGVGKALLTAILDAAREMPGLTQVRLSVSVTQREARALYTAVGFQTWGIEPRALCVDGEFVDEEHMYLPLAAHSPFPNLGIDTVHEEI